MHRLKDLHALLYDRPYMHEFVMSAVRQVEKGIRALDIAEGLIDIFLEEKKNTRILFGSAHGIGRVSFFRSNFRDDFFHKSFEFFFFLPPIGSRSVFRMFLISGILCVQPVVLLPRAVRPDLLLVCGWKSLGSVEGLKRLNQDFDVIIGEMFLHGLKHSSEMGNFFGSDGVSYVVAVRSGAVDQALAVNIKECKPRQSRLLADVTFSYVLRADAAI